MRKLGVTNVVIKSDKAGKEIDYAYRLGCYRSAHVLGLIHELSGLSNVNVNRWIFSEAQTGMFKLIL